MGYLPYQLVQDFFHQQYVLHIFVNKNQASNIRLLLVRDGQAPKLGKAAPMCVGSRKLNLENDRLQLFRDYCNWLVVSTPLKTISQIGNLPQLGVQKKEFETTYLGKESWWLTLPDGRLFLMVAIRNDYKMKLQV